MIRILLLLFFLALAPLQTLFAETLGKVLGSQITLEEVEDRKINELRQELHQHLERAFQLKALAQLRQAGKLKQPSLKPVTQKEIENFYQANQLASRGSLAEFTPRIRQFLEGQQAVEADLRQYQEALAQGWVQPSLKAPGEFLAQVPLETGYTLGNPQAKVMLLEFSDYQCPFCRRSQPTLTALRKRFQEKVLFGYRHFPLEFHTEADEAAVAAECAREQNKFEVWHSYLFQNPSALQKKDLLALGAKLKIKDPKKYSQCLEQDRYRSRVEHDLGQAAKIGISGTPSFVIGRYDPKSKTVKGEVVSGALPEEQLAGLIAKYLKP